MKALQPHESSNCGAFKVIVLERRDYSLKLLELTGLTED